MHTLDVNTSNVPAFLIKLWKLVEDSSCDDLIAWSDSGLSFIIKDQARFARELLPLYFKHNNMASFVRQLNMYGFRKVMNYEKSGLRTENNEMEFQHSFFIKEQVELLELIKRKIPNTRTVAEPHAKSNAKDILSDLTTIRDKQESMDGMLLKMKRENELLWKELTNMRQRHKHQEQVIDKVIQFLLQVMRNKPVGVGIQRKMARMLHDSPDTKGSTSQITTVDLLRESPSCIVVNNTNSSGPVIHEVIDQDVEDLPLSNLPSTGVKTLASFPSKSPLLSITSLSPTSKSPVNESEPISPGECPVESSNMSSPITSDIPLEPLNILEPLQARTSVINEDEDSVLSIPLEYITASDAAATLNTIPANTVITVPENDINNEGAVISNTITIPEVPHVNKIITNLSKENKTSITIPNSNVKKIIPAPSETAKNSSDKSNNSLSLPDLYSNSICLNDLKLETNNIQSSGHPKHDYEDPFMSSSLNTPQVNLIEDIDLSEFVDGDNKKLLKDSSHECTPPLNITQREHDYPAPISSRQQKASVKNSLSNHLLIVDEELNRLQGNIATNSWDVDVDKILGLFSSDGVVSNESFVDQLTEGITIKEEPEDILDNDLVSLTPQLLGVELENFRSPFLEQLDPETTTCDNLLEEMPSNISTDLKDVETYEDSSQMSELLDDTNKANSFNKRRRNSKVQRGKRRKFK